jgi:hypothetical protein
MLYYVNYLFYVFWFIYLFIIYIYCVYFIYSIDIIWLCVIMGIFCEHNIMSTKINVLMYYLYFALTITTVQVNKFITLLI